MARTLCCAYLRVYQPMPAFPTGERERLERLLAGDARPERASRGRPKALGLIAPAERKEVFEKVVDGVRYVCPAQTRLRTLLSLLAVTRSIPEGAAQVFFTTEEIQAAQRELDELQARRPELRPFMLQSPWHVPLRWFACFDDAERRIEQEDDHLQIRYGTTLPEAVARIDRALIALKGGVVHPVVVGMVYELNQWLGTFDQASLLELDYASVARLFDPDELADDHSAADIWGAIEALSRRDGLRAGLYWQRANERWAAKRTRESLN